MKDRIEPQLRALGYDTSTLEIHRFCKGSIYDIFLEGNGVGSYNHLTDTLDVPELPEE